MPKSGGVASRRAGRKEHLPRLICTLRPGNDEYHVDRLVQTLALVDFAQPIRHRAVAVDHPFPDRGKARRPRDVLITYQHFGKWRFAGTKPCGYGGRHE